jgi:hypothetical protein
VRVHSSPFVTRRLSRNDSGRADCVNAGASDQGRSRARWARPQADREAHCFLARTYARTRPEGVLQSAAGRPCRQSRANVLEHLPDRVSRHPTEGLRTLAAPRLRSAAARRRHWPGGTAASGTPRALGWPERWVGRNWEQGRAAYGELMERDRRDSEKLDEAIEDMRSDAGEMQERSEELGKRIRGDQERLALQAAGRWRPRRATAGGRRGAAPAQQTHLALRSRSVPRSAAARASRAAGCEGATVVLGSRSAGGLPSKVAEDDLGTPHMVRAHRDLGGRRREQR